MNSELLVELELKLKSAEVRSNPNLVNELLEQNFIEFGSSGKVYKKKDIENSEKFESNFSYEILNHSIKTLSEDVVLLIYKLKKTSLDGKKSEFSLHSSIWCQKESRVKMVFHQGTKSEKNIVF